MGTQFWLVQAFNGVSYGALLFLVGSGLSLIFGVMRIVNLSHGAYFLWGGYIALSVIHVTGSWAFSLPVAALAVARWSPTIAGSTSQFLAVIALATIVTFFVLRRVSIVPIDNDILRQVLL